MSKKTNTSVTPEDRAKEQLIEAKEKLVALRSDFSNVIESLKDTDGYKRGDHAMGVTEEDPAHYDQPLAWELASTADYGLEQVEPLIEFIDEHATLTAEQVESNNRQRKIKDEKFWADYKERQEEDEEAKRGGAELLLEVVDTVTLLLAGEAPDGYNTEKQERLVSVLMPLDDDFDRFKLHAIRVLMEDSLTNDEKGVVMKVAARLTEHLAEKLAA